MTMPLTSMQMLLAAFNVKGYERVIEDKLLTLQGIFQDLESLYVPESRNFSDSDLVEDLMHKAEGLFDEWTDKQIMHLMLCSSALMAKNLKPCGDGNICAHQMFQFGKSLVGAALQLLVNEGQVDVDHGGMIMFNFDDPPEASS